MRTAERRSEERIHARSWLHDRTLQMLEFIAAGGYDDDVTVERLREVAGMAADELRAFIGEGRHSAPADLRGELVATVARCQLLAGPLRIEFVHDGSLPLLGAARVAALAEATREALNNVCKHARATHAVVRCATGPDGEVVVTIHDDGAGFDPTVDCHGLGLAHSVVGRMLESGGSACVESRPGEATVITLRMPVRASEARPRTSRRLAA